MLKPVDAPEPYLVTVIAEYRKSIAQTGAAIGQAVLWVNLVADRQERAVGSPLGDLARELYEAQTTLALVNDNLLNAANILERENQQ